MRYSSVIALSLFLTACAPLPAIVSPSAPILHLRLDNTDDGCTYTRAGTVIPEERVTLMVGECRVRIRQDEEL